MPPSEPQYQSASSSTWSSVIDMASRCSDTFTRCTGGGGCGGTWLLVDAADGWPVGCSVHRCMLVVMLVSTVCRSGLGGCFGDGCC